MIVDLIRIEESESHGTFGVLKIDKEAFCVTLEPADRENQTSISSIPEGQYDCGRVNSPRFGITYQVFNVPKRSNILFHAGNVDDHTRCCILLAQYFGKLRGDRAILNSGNTFKLFMDRLKDHEQFHLTISTHY